MDAELKKTQCDIERKTSRKFRSEIPGIVDELVLSCSRDDCFDHIGLEPISSREAIIDLLHQAFRILYPGYFIPLLSLPIRRYSQAETRVPTRFRESGRDLCLKCSIPISSMKLSP